MQQESTGGLRGGQAWLTRDVLGGGRLGLSLDLCEPALSSLLCTWGGACLSVGHHFQVPKNLIVD